MSALTDALSKPNSKKVFLAEITAGKDAPVWEAAWNPYLNTDLSFSMWVSDLTQYQEGDDVTFIKEKVKGHDFCRLPVFGSARINYKEATDEINYRPSMSFDGLVTGGNISTMVDLPLSEYFSPTTMTFFFVLKKNPAVLASTNLFHVQAYPFEVALGNSFGSINFRHKYTNSISDATPGGTDDGEWKIVAIRRNGDEFNTYLNGTLNGTTTIASAPAMDTSAILQFFIGNFSNADGLKIAGIFGFKTALSDGDMDDFTAGLNNYYGLNDGGATAETIYTVRETENVVGVKVNGTELTLASDVRDCADTVGSYYWDGVRVYINSVVDPRDMANTTMLMIKYYFCQKEKDLNGRYYDSRLVTIPSLSMRIEEKFNGIGQVGGGTLVLNNGDNFFGSKRVYHWEAGQTVIKLGCDGLESEMDYSDYATIGTWNNDSWKYDLKNFEITLVEMKDRVKKSIPTENYTREEYPNIDESVIDNPKPIAYGKIYGAAPVCIDISTKTFKLAGHRIFSIDAVRVAFSNGWIGVEISDIDLEEATFVYAEWDGTSELSADFQGKPNADGTLMENAADIVEDLLLYIQETDLDADSFLESWNRFDRGKYYSETRRVTSLKPSFYISEYTDAYTVISELNSIVGSYLYTNANGKYVYKVFVPTPGEGLMIVSENEFKSLKVDISTKGVISKVHAKYANRLCEGWGVDYITERTRNQYLRNEKAEIVARPTVKLSDSADMRTQAKRRLIYEGEQTVLYTIDLLNGESFFKLPGDFIHLQFDELPTGGYIYDVVLEVYQVKYSLFPEASVQVVAGNMHGFGGMCGFIVADDAVLPSRFADLPGYGTGEIKWRRDWHRLIKDYARQNYCFVTDENGYADPTDPESYLPGGMF